MAVASLKELNDQLTRNFSGGAGRVLTIDSSVAYAEFKPLNAMPPSLWIPASQFYTPAEDPSYACTFRHYIRLGGSIQYSWNAWDMPHDTFDPMLHAGVVMPPNYQSGAPVTAIPFFCLNSVGTGTGIRFDIGAAALPDLASITASPTVDRKDTVVASPAVEKLYYGTQHSFTPANAAANAPFLNIRVRRIVGGGDAPPDQWSGVVIFLGLQIMWTTL